MSVSRARLLLTACLLALIAACGGGGGGLAAVTSAIGGGGSGGIGGTGAIITTGTIDGTGSIFVNGVRFELQEARITIDGEEATEAQLRPGMVSTVRGIVDDAGSSGNADRVSVQSALRGPINSIEADADGKSLRLDVLGQTVIAERTATLYGGTTFATLTAGDVITVSGFRDELGRIRATRIDVDEAFQPGVTEVRAEGVIAQLSGSQFLLANTLVDASSAQIDLPGGALREGEAVRVSGTLSAGTLVAQRVVAAPQPEDQLQADADARIQGSISDFQSSGQFRVDGVAVDARTARRIPDDLVLANRLVVEVSGTWDGSTLRATELRSRRGRIQLEALVQSIDGAAGTLTLGFFGGSISVATDSRTLFKDDEDDDRFISLADIRSGDAVEIEALEDGVRLLATRVARDDELDEEVLRAPVSAFVSGSSITMLGITYQTMGAEFEGEDDRILDAASFYAGLAEGDLVEITDVFPADGIADEVESETATALEGDEFDDDASDDDASDDDASDDDASDDDASDDDASDDDASDDDASDDDASDDDVAGSGD